MTYRGTVKGGTIVLEGDTKLPEGTVVEIHPLGEGATLAERFADVIGIAQGLPPDMAENHDHYIHGTPKRPRTP